jgi:hypothetical protein
MSKILEHIRQNKQDSQRLTGLKYEQLEELHYIISNYLYGLFCR